MASMRFGAQHQSATPTTPAMARSADASCHARGRSRTSRRAMPTPCTDISGPPSWLPSRCRTPVSACPSSRASARAGQDRGVGART
eukprot:11733165-Alexandrium_andersonii.AAC.1